MARRLGDPIGPEGWKPLEPKPGSQVNALAHELQRSMSHKTRVRVTLVTGAQQSGRIIRQVGEKYYEDGEKKQSVRLRFELDTGFDFAIDEVRKVEPTL